VHPIAFAAVLVLAAPRPLDRPAAFQPTNLPGSDIQCLPESERTLERIILGLRVNRTKLFLMPKTDQFDPKSMDPRVRFLRRQLYWLTFELEHGQIFRSAPGYSRFFLAVPDARFIPDSLGNEEEAFRDYLKTRVGWSETEIAKRIRFFKVPLEVAYPRDLAEPIGRDARGRLVLALGEDSDEWYAEPLQRLVSAFPDEFMLRRLPGINTEGGDLAQVWLPEGKLGLMVGRHRVLRYLETRHGGPLAGQPIEPRRIEEARQAYSRAFSGLEVIIVGEEGLREPHLVSDELFHSDMITTVARGREGMLAFVPSYSASPVDALTHNVIGPAVRLRAQREYDQVAGELGRRGYHVVRLPFVDHPVRTPVQVAVFVDPRDGRQSLLIGRYPYHLELPDGRNPQTLLQEQLDRLDGAVTAWRNSPTEERWNEVRQTLARTWVQIDAAAASPNPNFELIEKAYSSQGIRVLQVPLYPFGQGGLHCELLN
jgi:hypothetical protein